MAWLFKHHNKATIEYSTYILSVGELNVMGLDPVELFLMTLRESVPDATTVFTQGHCFKLYLILRRIYPQAKPYYRISQGHVYTRIDGHYYDIHGKHNVAKADREGHSPLIYLPTEPRIFHQAFRWSYTKVQANIIPSPC